MIEIKYILEEQKQEIASYKFVYICNTKMGKNQLGGRREKRTLSFYITEIGKKMDYIDRDIELGRSCNGRSSFCGV